MRPKPITTASDLAVRFIRRAGGVCAEQDAVAALTRRGEPFYGQQAIELAVLRGDVARVDGQLILRREPVA